MLCSPQISQLSQLQALSLSSCGSPAAGYVPLAALPALRRLALDRPIFLPDCLPSLHLESFAFWLELKEDEDAGAVEAALPILAPQLTSLCLCNVYGLDVLPAAAAAGLTRLQCLTWRPQNPAPCPASPGWRACVRSPPPARPWRPACRLWRAQQRWRRCTSRGSSTMVMLYQEEVTGQAVAQAAYRPAAHLSAVPERKRRQTLARLRLGCSWVADDVGRTSASPVTSAHASTAGLPCSRPGTCCWITPL